MTKVEDSANWTVNDMFHELICYCGGRDFQDDATKALKAAILAKARSEGVAEGAEQGTLAERDRLRMLCEGPTRKGQTIRQVKRGDDSYFLVPCDEFYPASVLAPTKESEK